MLQGTLDNFALDEVLQLLSSTSKTGRLKLNGDRGTGSLALDHGQLLEAHASGTTDGTSIDDVLFELLRFQDGEFNFTNTEHEEGDLKVDTSKALASAGRRLADWRSVQAVVPSPHHIVTPSADLPAAEITIDRDEWAALSFIGRGSPASRFCEESGLGEVEGCRCLKALSERGLVVISAPPERQRTAERPTASAPAAATAGRSDTRWSTRPDTRAGTDPAPAPAPGTGTGTGTEPGGVAANRTTGGQRTTAAAAPDEPTGPQPAVPEASPRMPRSSLSDDPPIPMSAPSGAADDDRARLAEQRYPTTPGRIGATRRAPGVPPGNGNGGTPPISDPHDDWPRHRPPMPASPTPEQLAEATAHGDPEAEVGSPPDDVASDESLPQAAVDAIDRDDYDYDEFDDYDDELEDRPDEQETSRSGRLRRHLRNGL